MVVWGADKGEKLPSKVLIRGAGDLASGTAHRLWQAGFDIVMLELPQPLVVRRSVSLPLPFMRVLRLLKGLKQDAAGD